MASTNTNNPVVNSLTFAGSIVGQAAIQAQGIAGGLTFLLPNIPPIVGQLLDVSSINGNNVFLGWASPSSTLSFSEITGLLSVAQLASVEGNGSKVQLTNGSAPPSPVTVQLGLAATYAILAAAGITNTGSTSISGGVIGSYPTTAITGFNPPPATVDNADAQAALAAALAAYTHYSGLTFTSLSATSANLSALSGGGSPPTAGTYTPGNYSAGTSMDIPTSITLDAQGNPNAIFVFKAGSTVTLESGASIFLVNGAQAANVVWLVGSSFTSVAPSTMVGTILANTSITLGGGALNGRALAGVVTSSGAVTIPAAEAITVPTGAGVIAAGDVVVYDANGNVVSSGILLSSLGGAAGVLTFNGRSGAVTPQSGDYTVAQVVGAAPLASPSFTGTVTLPNATYAISISGNAAAATTAGTISGSITESQVTGLTAALAAIAPLYSQTGAVPSAGDNHIVSGTATLDVAGSPAESSVTVTLSGAAAFTDVNYAVQVTRTSTPGGTGSGHLWVSSQTTTSFVINSTDATDSTSTVAWTAIGF